MVGYDEGKDGMKLVRDESRLTSDPHIQTVKGDFRQPSITNERRPEVGIEDNMYIGGHLL